MRLCLSILLIVLPLAVEAASGASADDFLIVDCLLPGQVRQIGTRATYVSARRAEKTSAADCAARGGEFVREDRASASAALKVWMPAAQEGDSQARINVGTIYERGLDIAPDYERAAHWYRLAADAGSVRAQLKLAELYESGLGVPVDLQQALYWYQRATGAERPPVVAPAAAATPNFDREVQRLSHQVDDMARDNARLQAELTVAQQALGENRQLGRSLRDELQAQVATLTQTLEARQAAVRDLDGQLRRAERALGRAQQEQQAAAEVAAQARAAAEEEALRTLQQEDTIAELMRRLTQRESTLGREQGEAGALRVRLAELEDRLAELSARRALQTSAARTAQLAPPTLTLIDPQLAVTRGLVKVASSAPTIQRVVGRVTAPAGLLSLTVNGAPTQANAMGVFTTDLSDPSRGLVAIVAVDQLGQRADLSFDYQPALSSPGAASTGSSWRTLPFGRYYALVIGNNDYRHLPRLQTAVADARAVADVLRRQYGFSVTELIDADRYGILSALNELRETLTAEDSLLIYYAGHGELDQVNMRGHWLPVDAEPDSSANWISNVAITDVLNAMQAKHVMLLADSCYSGSLTRSGLTELRTAMTAQEERNWIQIMLSRRSRVALTSGGLSPVLDSGGGGHSVFAGALLEVLRANQDLLEGRDLYDRVAARVAYRAANLRFEQVPEFAPISHAGHEAGAFFLVPADI